MSGSMLSLTVKSKEAVFGLVFMTADSQLRKKDIEGFCDNRYTTPQQTKCNSLDKKLSMRILRIVINMLKCSSLQLMGADWGMDGEGLIFFKGLVGTGFLEFAHVPVIYGQHK